MAAPSHMASSLCATIAWEVVAALLARACEQTAPAASHLSYVVGCEQHISCPR